MRAEVFARLDETIALVAEAGLFDIDDGALGRSPPAIVSLPQLSRIFDNRGAGTQRGWQLGRASGDRNNNRLEALCPAQARASDRSACHDLDRGSGRE